MKTMKQLVAQAYVTMNVVRVPPLMVAKTLGLTEAQLDAALAKGKRGAAQLVLATIQTITEAELKAEEARRAHVDAFLERRKTAIRTVKELVG